MCTHSFREADFACECCSVRCSSQAAQVQDVGREQGPHPCHCCHSLLPKATSQDWKGASSWWDPSLSERLLEVVATLPPVVIITPQLRGPEDPVNFCQSQQNSQSFFWDYRHNELIGSPNHWPSLWTVASSDGKDWGKIVGSFMRAFCPFLRPLGLSRLLNMTAEEMVGGRIWVSRTLW